MFDTSTADMSNIQIDTSVQTSAASTSVLYQSWALLEHEHSIDWGADDASAPSIHIVSTVRALTESLFVSKDLEVFIDRSSRFVFPPTQLRAARSSPVPIFDDGTLTVTLWQRNSTVGENQHFALRLPVDLRTLLTSVLVSPKAPTRFVELVSDLVLRISHAKVSRASWAIDSPAVPAAYARRG